MWKKKAHMIVMVTYNIEMREGFYSQKYESCQPWIFDI